MKEQNISDLESIEILIFSIIRKEKHLHFYKQFKDVHFNKNAFQKPPQNAFTFTREIGKDGL